MAHSKGLSSEAASPSATTLLDSSTREPTGRTQKVRPVNLNIDYLLPTWNF